MRTCAPTTFISAATQIPMSVDDVVAARHSPHPVCRAEKLSKNSPLDDRRILTRSLIYRLHFRAGILCQNKIFVSNSMLVNILFVNHWGSNP